MSRANSSLAGAFFAIVCFALPTGAAGAGDSVFIAATSTAEQLNEVFADLRRERGSNPDQALTWRFVFTDPEPKELEIFAVRLVRDGYRIFKLQPGSGDQDAVLRVERFERHTPGSLLRRNQALRDLAAEYRVATFRGLELERSR